MAKKRPDYPPKYRQQLVELVRAGRSADALAKEFDPSPQTIRNSVARADRDDSKRGDGLTSHERDELRRLRRENKQLWIERGIVSKAAAWFARKTNAVPKKGSGS